VLGEHAGGRVAAAQVLGARLVAEAAEVDDAPDARLHAHLREGPRGARLALLEVAALAAPHRVHEVVGDVDSRPGAVKRGGLEHVADEELQARVLGQLAPRPLAIAHERADVRVVGQQPAHEDAADEARRACHECVHRRGIRHGTRCGFESARPAPRAAIGFAR